MIHLRTMGGLTLLANSVVTLLLAIGYTVIRNDTMVFSIAGILGNALGTAAGHRPSRPDWTVVPGPGAAMVGGLTIRARIFPLVAG